MRMRRERRDDPGSPADAIAVIRGAALPFEGEADYAPLLELVGSRKIVCIGEASHGTHDFYHARAEITKRLIERHGFDAVVIEGDWPDAWCVNRYVRGASEDRSSVAALSGFRRFPQWMWRNTVVVDFVDWLRLHNERLPGERKAGFLGMDLYSLHASIDAVLRYLRDVDPEGYRRARERYSCFEHFGEDPQAYGYLASGDLRLSCEGDVVRQLLDLRRNFNEYVRSDGQVASDDFFSAEQNARLVKNAEEYYRSMFRGRVSSWNLRDSHMVETLETIVGHLEAQGRDGKVVVWAHNSHLGDARATEVGQQGEHNVGQLVRQRWGERRCALVGFTTHTGTVSAADDWDDPVDRKQVRPSLAGSVERLFHDVAEASGSDRFLLLLAEGAADAAARQALAEPRLERAIGVIYRPRTERMSHYFHCAVAEQFDAVIHLDETRALEPLEKNPSWERGEVPETFPSGV